MLDPAPPCLLWDIDGTLTDSTALIADALDYIYQRFYKRTMLYEDRRALIGTPLKNQIRVFGEPEAFGVSEHKVMHAFIDYYEQNGSQERLLHDVIDVLKEGKQQGFPTGIVTSKNHAEIANTLPRLGIAHCVDVAITADDVAAPKPDPEGMLLALKRLEVPEDRTEYAVYIGDTIHDMKAANSAGIRAVGVSWGAAGREQLVLQKPYLICDTPGELRKALY